jgi:hypothetical protein
MKAYFDLNNFKHFFSDINKHAKGEDVLRLLKKQFDIHLNFNIEEMDENLELQLQEFIEGVNNYCTLTHSYDALGERPIQLNFEISDRTGVYLIDDPVVDVFKKKYEVLTAQPGEEIDVLGRLLFCREDYGLHDERTINDTDFKSWSELRKYTLPFSTLLLIDRYIFKGSAIGGNYGLLNFNLGQILKEFYRNKKAKARLVFLYQIDPFNRNPSYIDKGPDFNDLCKKIKSIVKSVNKQIPTPEIVLISVPVSRDGREPIADEHDRNLITNYSRVKCGDSFVKFLESGEVTGARTNVDLYSHARRKFKENTDYIVKNATEIIEEVKKRYPRYIHSNFELNGHVINF